MDYAVEIVDSVDRLRLDAWDALRSGPDDLFMDPRFLRAVERSMSDDCRIWYVLLLDGDRPVASACLCHYQVDGAVLGSPWMKRMALRVRKRIPRFLLLPILFCGLPVSCGQSHLRFADDADKAAVLRALDRLMRELARDPEAWLLIYKEFDRGTADDLSALGYRRADSLPMNGFESRFESFDGFRRALRSHYRYKLNRSRRKFACVGLETLYPHGDEILDLYTDRVHALYEAVVDRAAYKLEVLPRTFFCELVRQLPEHVRFMAVRLHGRIIGFSWGLLTPGHYQNMFIGLDYSLNSRFDLYFNVMARNVDFAMRQGVDDVLLGQTADDFKSRLGCDQRDLYIYAAPTNRIVALVMKLFFVSFFPPPTRVEARNLFRPGGVASPDGLRPEAGERVAKDRRGGSQAHV